jgi:nicotinamide-nucleotide amidase
MEQVGVRVLKVAEMTEQEVKTVLSDFLTEEGVVRVKVIPNLVGVEIHLGVWGDRKEVASLIDQKENQIRARLGDKIYGADDETLEMVIGYLLYIKRLTLSCAESCTGGLVSHRLTNISGASRYFHGGIVAYSNQAKIDLLDVKEETLRQFGAVSRETCEEMAQGVALRFKTDLGLGITGVAGPTGGTKEKPVGLVYMSLFTKDETFVKKYLLNGTREEIKQKSAELSLNLIRNILQSEF